MLEGLLHPLRWGNAFDTEGGEALECTRGGPLVPPINNSMYYPGVVITPPGGPSAFFTHYDGNAFYTEGAFWRLNVAGP